jgi:hypothetical protein
MDDYWLGIKNNHAVPEGMLFLAASSRKMVSKTGFVTHLGCVRGLFCFVKRTYAFFTLSKEPF